MLQHFFVKKNFYGFYSKGIFCSGGEGGCKATGPFQKKLCCLAAGKYHEMRDDDDINELKCQKVRT